MTREVPNNTNWEAFKWEMFGSIINDKFFSIIESNEVFLPVKNFIIKRDKNLNIIITTTAGTPANNEAIEYPPGTVYQNTSTIEFKSITGATAIASGVMRYSWKSTIDKKGSISSQEIASAHNIKCRLKSVAQQKYLIEWLANVDDRYYHWPDIMDDEIKIISVRTFCKNKTPLILTAKKSSGGGRRNCINISVGGHEIYLGTCSNVTLSNKKMPGFILYKSNLPNDVRRKIRTCLSFIFGRTFIYLGNTAFDIKWDVVSVEAVSAYSTDRAVFDLPTLPPYLLSMRTSIKNFIDNETFSGLVNSLYENYDKYNLGYINWLYVHSISAPIHSAAANWGATFEAMQRAFVKAHEELFSTELLNPTKWKELKRNFMGAIDELDLEEETLEIFKNKINSLNLEPKSRVTVGHTI